MTKHIKVLLIDDNPSDRILERRLIEKEITDVEVEEVRSMDELATHLEARDYDIVVTDYQLMWANGLDILRMVKMKDPQKPVIMATGTGSEEIAVEAMKSGLNDYIIKNARHINKLPLSIRSAVSHSRVMQCAIETEARLEYILGSLKVGVFKTDMDGRVESANEQFYAMVSNGGGAGGDINIFAKLSFEDGGQLPREWGKLMSTNGFLVRLHGDALGRWFRLRLAPGAAEGNCMHGLLEDISEQIELERRMAEALTRIEENLKQFSFLSDRLRNPLSVIYSLTQGLEERKARMSKEEMLRINEVLDSLDKGWVETRHLLRQWQEKYK